MTDNSYTLSLVLGNGSGDYTYREIVYQAPDQKYANANVVAIVQSWDLPTKTLTVTNIAGEFANGSMVIGASSNARYTLVGGNNPLDVNIRTDFYDNLYIENQANGIVNFSETNPFGTI